MIKEELYIIKDGEKYNLDLPTPSGITLKWVSNLFSDISKLTCSYSYTFKLSMTANNRRVLNIADDIRHSSVFARISVDAEFYINGVCLCPNANLHVSEIGASSFSCVMTWRVLKAFEKMKSDSINLNELPSIGTFVWKTGDDSLVYGFPTQAHTNMEDVLYPNYDAGIAYEEGTPPKPVVPVYRLVQLINDYYGVKFMLGRELAEGMGLLPKANFNNKRYYGKNVYDDYLTYGVLPITGIGVSSGTQNKFTIANVEGKSMYDNTIDVGSKEYRASWQSWVVTSTNQGTKDSIRSVVYEKDSDLSNWHRYADIMGISFNGNKYIQSTVCEISSETTSVNEETSKHLYGKGCGQTSGGVNLWTHWEIYACTGVLKDSFTLQKVVKGGNFKSRYLFRCLIDSELRGEAEVRVSKEDIKAKKAEAKDYWWIYLLQVKQGENDEDASVDVYSDESEDWMGLRSISREETDTEYIYKFDFGVKYDVRKLSIDAADDDEVGLCFWSGSYEEGWATKDADSKVTGTGTKYTNTATFSYLRVASITPIVQFDGLPAEMGIIENLPDISCFDFLKNLFYLNGALPRVEKDGVTITAMYYNQLRDRVVNGDSLDWSKKLLSGVNKNPTSAKTYNSNFGRENYFLMATSEKDKTDEEKLKEVELYGKGYGQIDIDDKRLDEEKNVFTSCFYPGLRQDLAYPNLLTGRTVKVWNGEKQVQSDVNPIYGFVNYRALNSTYEDVSNAFSRPMLKTYGVYFKHIRMDAFEPFDNMDEFYGYLKSILTDYVIIKEKFNLNEFDLMNFDESMPVYLQKYNCCFAVSTIQRDKNGVCTVELVKLPYVQASYNEPEENDAEKVSYSYLVRGSVISFELSLTRDYTSNRCPILYDLFVNNRYEGWSTTYNTLDEPVNGGTYLSRWVAPYEPHRLKDDTYTMKFTIPSSVLYSITKLKGVDAEYTKEMSVKLRVYYDDVRCEPGTHTLTFSKSEFGTYHVFKFIFDICNADGEIVERVRKKMYYFVSVCDESVITDDFGDEHENDDTIKVNDVTISGVDSIADKEPHAYMLSFLPAYADVNAKFVVVSVAERASSVSVSNVSTSGFTLTASDLPESETTLTIMVEATLEDDSSFTKEKLLSVLRPSLYISTEDIDVIDGSGSATFLVSVRPTNDGGVIKEVKTTHDNVKATIYGNKTFELTATNVTESMNENITVTVEYKGMTITCTTTVKINASVNRLDYYGALIIDRNGNYYTKDEWLNSGLENDDADGVAVSDKTHRFIISKKNLSNFGVWGASGTLIDGIATSDDVHVAQQDFAGKANTDIIAKALSDSFAAKLTGRNDFPSGKTEYCAALGEWYVIGGKRTYINQLLNAIGADELFYNSSSCDYFSTTQNNAYRLWVAHFGANVELNIGYKDSGYFMRPLAEIPEDATPTPIGNLEIVGGDSFKAKNGSGSAEYNIKYSPEGVSIADVSVTSSNPNVVATKTADNKFKLSVSEIIVDEVATIMVKARLNNMMRKVSKTITAVGEIIVDYDKLDNANALILCKDYSLYTEEEWSKSQKTKSDVEGIAVSDGMHRLIMSISDAGRYFFGGRNKAIEGLSTDIKDYNGKSNTDAISKAITGSDGYFTSEPYSAAAVAKNFLFPTGKAGFLPSYAEWALVDKYYDKVEALLTAIGGDALIKDFSFTYWASTIQDELRGYCYHCYKSSSDGSINHDMGSYIYRSDTSFVRPFRIF